MGLFQNIKNLFRKGGAAIGMVNELGKITDDPRIGIPFSEYERARIARQYYANDFEKIEFKNSYGDVRRRDFQSLNVTKTCARRLASIIFNEQCSVNVEEDADEDNADSQNATVQDFIAGIFEKENFYLTYEEFLEKWIVFGWGAIRPYVSNDEIKLAWVNAEQFYPLKSNTSKVNEAAIASVVQRSENNEVIYYTLLEFHQRQDDGSYAITYELYRSNQRNIVGIQVPLNSIDDYANLPQKIVLNNIEAPLFAYFKTPGANNQDIGSPLGLGIVDNAKDIIDCINMTNDKFFWEVKMGQRRVAVPAEMVRKMDADESIDHPNFFDVDENVYLGMYGNDDLKITDLTSPIRNEQFTATLDYYLHAFENSIGLSQGTFTTTPSGIQTATEVVTNNSMTYQTRSSYVTQVEKQIISLVKSILELAQCGELFSDGKPRWTGDIDSVCINIDFNDGVFVDKDSQLKNDLSVLVATTMPKVEFIKRNYGLSNEQAQEWLAEIQAETTEPNTSAESGMFGGDADYGGSNAGEGQQAD